MDECSRSEYSLLVIPEHDLPENRRGHEGAYEEEDEGEDDEGDDEHEIENACRSLRHDALHLEPHKLWQGIRVEVEREARSHRGVPGTEEKVMLSRQHLVACGDELRELSRVGSPSPLVRRDGGLEGANLRRQLLTHRELVGGDLRHHEDEEHHRDECKHLFHVFYPFF